MLKVRDEIEKLKKLNPFNLIDSEELNEVFADFATLFWILMDKKLTKTTYFINIIENDIIKNEMKAVCGIECDIEFYREFMSRYPCVCNSKMIRNRLKSPQKSAIINK